MHPALILAIAVSIVLGGILIFRLHAFVALLLAAMTVALLTPQTELRKYADEQVAKGDWTEQAAGKFVTSPAPTRVAQGFGKTCASIGILIAMASIIGKCLLDSGAADKIVRSTLRLVGEPRAPVAFIGSGFLLGIPVFFDTVFYLMMPLGKAMRLRTGGNYLLYILAIVAGGSMAHSLVPPTPGPLYVAEQLGVDLAVMILGGCAIGSFSSTCGYLFARWLNRRMEIPLRESADVSLADLEELSKRDESNLPPVWLALLPILLPVVLITARTALDAFIKSGGADWAIAAQPFVNTVGDKNFALILAAGIALGMVAWQLRSDAKQLAASVQTALASGGVIILITAGGGAFGATVRQCGIADEIAKLTSGISPIMILPVAFIVTTLIRTAQGSATVAMMTAVSVLASFAEPGVLSFHPVYLALAIGCGSKPIAWMADSGFWVICKMSGMTEAEGLKTVTPLSIVMGISGLFATMVAATVLPLN
ncbi:MAG: GntP family permease [Planctomycetes bacterium]|nr:GntP family permease [Planctomycetota bacterium]